MESSINDEVDIFPRNAIQNLNSQWILSVLTSSSLIYLDLLLSKDDYNKEDKEDKDDKDDKDDKEDKKESFTRFIYKR